MSTQTESDYETNPAQRGKWLSAVVGLLGVWMVVQAALFDLVAAQFWNDVVVGALLIALGGYNYYRRSDELVGNVGVASLVALLGLWLVAAPFVLGPDAGLTETADALPFWNDVVAGLLALVLGAYSAYQASEGTRTGAPAGR